MTELSERSRAFRSAIAAFIDGRREAKLKGQEDDGERAAKYAYSTWLADAARRVGQIQAVTHVLKATHPDARGTNLHVPPATLPSRPEIGSHVLGEAYAEDVVGNAAALDVFKFLKLEVEGRRLLNLDSALERMGAGKEVARLTRALADFLLTDPPPNDATRERRRKMEQALGMELPLFAARVQASLEAGWSRHADCRLPLCEQLWLDPERLDLPDRPDHLEEDQAFRAAYHWGDWPDQVAGRFANWLNDRLRKAGLTTVGDGEYRHWARQAVIDAAWPVPQQRRAGGAA